VLHFVDKGLFIDDIQRWCVQEGKSHSIAVSLPIDVGGNELHPSQWCRVLQYQALLIIISTGKPAQCQKQ